MVETSGGRSARSPERRPRNPNVSSSKTGTPVRVSARAAVGSFSSGTCSPAIETDSASQARWISSVPASGVPCTRARRASGIRRRAVTGTWRRGATMSRPDGADTRGRVAAASGAPRPGQRYRIARPCTSSSAIGVNRTSSRSPARRAARSKATSIRPKGNSNVPPRGTTSPRSFEAKLTVSAQLYRSAAIRSRGSNRPGATPTPSGNRKA